MAPPLAGVRVLEVAELIPGPFVGLMLRELGAEVVKVERPPHGDNCRLLGPGVFEALNRGKSSIMLDLKQRSDRERLVDMVGEFDILIESYRPGVAARLGIDHARLRAIQPRLIYASLSGYGQDGPWAGVAGHDVNYAALSGILALSPGSADPLPDDAGVPIADLAGAQQALSAILAALFQRERTGLGQFLDISITDVLLYWLNVRLGAFYAGGINEPADQRKMALTRPAYGAFRCADGLIVTIAALEDHLWAKLVEALDLTTHLTGPLARYAERMAKADDINEAIGAICATLDRQPLLARLIELGVPAAPLLQPFEVFSHPQFQERDRFSVAGSGPLSRFPVQLAGMPYSLESAPSLPTRA